MAPGTTASPLRIAILGAGGIGGYFAAVLARAGHDVHLLARGPHLDAIREQKGLVIREPDGSTSLVDVNASDDPRALSGADYAIVAVKSYSLSGIAAPLKDLTAGTACVVVPFLNGVDIVDRLVDLGVPRKSLLDGVAYISVARTSPGVVARLGDFRRLFAGEISGKASDRATRFVAAFQDTGIDAKTSDAMQLELWRKFMALATMAAVCGLGRSSIGAVREAPFGPFVIERSVREIANVGRTSGVPLADEDVSQTIRALGAVAPGTKPSFLADIERGGPNELDVLSGTVARLGLSLGVDTPVHATVVAALSALQAEAKAGA
jgi:2-dehydropantoate 2-reductase